MSDVKRRLYKPRQNQLRSQHGSQHSTDISEQEMDYNSPRHTGDALVGETMLPDHVRRAVIRAWGKCGPTSTLNEECLATFLSETGTELAAGYAREKSDDASDSRSDSTLDRAWWETSDSSS